MEEPTKLEEAIELIKAGKAKRIDIDAQTTVYAVGGQPDPD